MQHVALGASQSVYGATDPNDGYALGFDNDSRLHIADDASIGQLSGTNPWTYELWFKNMDSSVNSGYQYLIFNGEMPDTSDAQFELHHQSGQGYEARFCSSTGLKSIGEPTNTPTTAFADNVWHHCAVVNDGTTVTMYMNGTRLDSIAADSIHDDAAGIMIGRRPHDGYCWYGWMDDIRVSNIARYTTDFTPPTSRLTTDDNTVLLIQAIGETNASTNVIDRSGSAAGIGTDTSGMNNHWQAN